VDFPGEKKKGSRAEFLFGGRNLTKTTKRRKEGPHRWEGEGERACPGEKRIIKKEPLFLGWWGGKGTGEICFREKGELAIARRREAHVWWRKGKKRTRKGSWYGGKGENRQVQCRKRRKKKAQKDNCGYGEKKKSVTKTWGEGKKKRGKTCETSRSRLRKAQGKGKGGTGDPTLIVEEETLLTTPTTSGEKKRGKKEGKT